MIDRWVSQGDITVILMCLCVRMSGGKKRSGFQITSACDLRFQPTSIRPISSKHGPETSSNQEPPPPTALTGSSSQPTTPSLKRKYISQDAPGQGMGSSSRFRVVRLVVGGAGSGGRGEPYRRGRWMCTELHGAT
ncbi:hypothetical protein L3Q82_016349 [Scortum barcoo]|uniref:Uncharacterized protein n=1 Tax=Scortum barcoo TaxID=214431 RepID=A0ACB8XAJ7_9TELE|nr:hypothetical protein L3Q82_016349 [Scortum barcoo]